MTAIYEDRTSSVEERLADLIRRMTLKEKVGQLCQLDGRQDAERFVGEYHVGSFLHVMGESALRLQRAAQSTRLGIPLIFGIDAIHGHAFWPGAAVYPTQLALSCSFDPGLAETLARQTAREMRATGVHWTFSPVMDVARDLRWGRVDETSGEDPLLVGLMGAAFIRGYQGEKLGDPDHVLACMKHFAGYSETTGGRDSSEADLSRRKLHNVFLRSFEAGVRAGAATLMTAYHAIDGVPCTVNHWLLTEVLRGEWAFQGFVVTDWQNIEHLVNLQRAAETIQAAAAAALIAGNDMSMNVRGFVPAAIEAVEDGRLPLEVVENSCRRILRLKFELGLFDEHRFPRPERVHEVIGCVEHVRHAEYCALKSAVLLKNNGVLPIPMSARNILVTGANADDVRAQLGDWSFGSGQAEFQSDGHARQSIITLLDGLRAEAPPGTEITYARGASPTSAVTDDIAKAVQAAANSDLVVAAVGDDIPLIGEGKDRLNLELSGAQLALLQALEKTGKPLVVVLIASKPHLLGWTEEHADAIVCAFNPGMRGGAALAQLLYGRENFAGRLSISFPRENGQIPVVYNQIFADHAWNGWVDCPKTALYPFGFGLSYTRFEYSELELDSPALAEGQPLMATLTVTNVGDRAGTDVVQAYLFDKVTESTRPERELVGFTRVELTAGLRRRVQIAIPFERLSYVNSAGKRVVEPGEFELFVGANSRDATLKANFRV